MRTPSGGALTALPARAVGRYPAPAASHTSATRQRLLTPSITRTPGPYSRHANKTRLLAARHPLAAAPSALSCRMWFTARWITLPVTRIAGRGGAGDRREPRRAQSGRRRGPRSTSRLVPRARSRALAEHERRPRPAAHAQRARPAPGARSSPSLPAGRAGARTPPAIPGRERTPPRDQPERRTPGRSPDPARRGRNVGFGPGRQGATESGCSRRPRHHLGSLLFPR
jgi:hypothetical protein